MTKYRLLVVLLALSSSSLASAAGCDLDQPTYFERLSEFSRLQCHESKPEFVKETKIVEAGLKGVDKKQEAQYARALQVMASVQIAVQSLSTDGVLPTTVSQQLAQEISSHLEEARLELSQLQDGSLQIDGVTAWWPSRWMVGGSSSEDTWFLLQKSLNDQSCLDAVTPKCDEIFDGHMTIARYVVAMDVISDFVLKGPQLNAIAQRELAHKQWKSYLEDHQFQYWWELGANRCLFNPRIPKDLSVWKKTGCFVPFLGPSLADRWIANASNSGKTAAGRNQGWVSPVDHRIVFLHPDIGVLYADQEPSGNSMNVALVMQWLGYLRWDGYDEKTGKMNNAYGISLVSTFADLATSDNHGFGVMGHYRNFGLSVTRHGDDWVVYLNLDLLKGIQDTEKRVDKLMDEINK